MTLSFRLFSSGAVCLATVVCASNAEARDVVYRAPSECPTKEEVASRIEGRAPIGASTRVGVTKTPDGFHGDLVVDDGKKRIARSVDAQTCGAVIEALALVVALNREDDAPVEPEAAPPPASVTTTGNERPDADVDVNRAPLPPARKTQWSIGGSYGFAGFAGGGLGYGSSIFVDVAPGKRLVDFPLFESSARAKIGFVFPHDVGDPPLVRDAKGIYCAGCGPVMSLIAHDIDLCPVGAGRDGTVGFSLCGRTQVGVLVTDNAGTTADARARFWAAMGPVGRVRVTIRKGGASGFFELEGGALGALRRDRFHFDGYDTVVAHPWGWVFASSVGVVLP